MKQIERGALYLDVGTTAALRPGSMIGAYRIVRELGTGGMGAVFVAEHVLLGRAAAIKVLHPSLSSNDEIVQRFFNEAKAVTQISDPGIVQVFDYGSHVDGSAYLVMELLEGEAVDKRLRRLGKFSLEDAVRLGRMMCTSLAVAHAKGIVHRDLKPENLFLVGDPAVTGGDRIKILDFGIAKLSSNEPNKLKTRTGLVIGTPVYMSPEQCRGAEIDQRSDIYSLGCVLFCMLTGAPPFDGDSTGELIAAHLREPAPRASGRIVSLPPEIDRVLERCLAKAVGERYSSMTELAADLAAVERRIYAVGAPTVALRPAQPATIVAPIHPGTMVLPTPTTLGGANGQTLPRPPKRSHRGVLAVVAVLVIGGGALAATSVLTASAPPTVAAIDAAVVRTITPDAATPDAALPDASVDATIDATIAPDAAPSHPPPPPHHHPVRSPHDDTDHLATPASGSDGVGRSD